MSERDLDALLRGEVVVHRHGTWKVIEVWGPRGISDGVRIRASDASPDAEIFTVGDAKLSRAALGALCRAVVEQGMHMADRTGAQEYFAERAINPEYQKVLDTARAGLADEFPKKYYAIISVVKYFELSDGGVQFKNESKTGIVEMLHPEDATRQSVLKAMTEELAPDMRDGAVVFFDVQPLKLEG